MIFVRRINHRILLVFRKDRVYVAVIIADDVANSLGDMFVVEQNPDITSQLDISWWVQPCSEQCLIEMSRRPNTVIDNAYTLDPTAGRYLIVPEGYRGFFPIIPRHQK